MTNSIFQKYLNHRGSTVFLDLIKPKKKKKGTYIMYTLLQEKKKRKKKNNERITLIIFYCVIINHRRDYTFNEVNPLPIIILILFFLNVILSTLFNLKFLKSCNRTSCSEIMFYSVGFRIIIIILIY